jgi:hypothetical protein
MRMNESGDMRRNIGPGDRTDTKFKKKKTARENGHQRNVKIMVTIQPPLIDIIKL